MWGQSRGIDLGATCTGAPLVVEAKGGGGDAKWRATTSSERSASSSSARATRRQPCVRASWQRPFWRLGGWLPVLARRGLDVCFVAAALDTGAHDAVTREASADNLSVVPVAPLCAAPGGSCPARGRDGGADRADMATQRTTWRLNGVGEESQPRAGSGAAVAFIETFPLRLDPADAFETSEQRIGKCRLPAQFVARAQVPSERHSVGTATTRQLTEPGGQQRARP
jgi:hypothetical protein